MLYKYISNFIVMLKVITPIDLLFRSFRYFENCNSLNIALNSINFEWPVTWRRLSRSYIQIALFIFRDYCCLKKSFERRKIFASISRRINIHCDTLNMEYNRHIIRDFDNPFLFAENRSNFSLPSLPHFLTKVYQKCIVCIDR